MELRDLRPLTLVVSVMVAINALITPMILGWSALSPDTFDVHITPVADAVDGTAMLFKLATIIVFGRWIYMAGRNLVDAGYQDLEFTPAARIWWFAVPFANFVMPFRGMRELWNASHGEGDYTVDNGLVGAWWALWLGQTVAVIILRVSAGPDAGAGPLWFQSAAYVVLSIVAIALIRRIAKAQTKLGAGELAEVFA
jgi:hypothetical protein